MCDVNLFWVHSGFNYWMGSKIQSVPLRKNVKIYELGPWIYFGYIPDSITGRDRPVPKNFNHRRVCINSICSLTGKNVKIYELRPWIYFGYIPDSITGRDPSRS